MERAQVHQPQPKEQLEWDESIDAGGGVLDLPHGMKELTRIGCTGDPTVATAETGEKLYNFIVNWTCQVIKRHFGIANDTVRGKKVGSRGMEYGSRGKKVFTRKERRFTC